MCSVHMVVKGTPFHLSMLLQLQPGTILVAVNSESDACILPYPSLIPACPETWKKSISPLSIAHSPVVIVIRQALKLMFELICRHTACPYSLALTLTLHHSTYLCACTTIE